MHALDIAVVLVYAVGITIFGSWFYRRTRSASAFMTAGQRLPVWVVGMSIFATYLSSITFLALPGKAYAADWSPWAFSLSIPLAAWVAVRWFVPLYRATTDASAYTYLERRFGLWARLYGASFYLLTQIARTATILFLVALPLEPLTGWPTAWVIVVTGALVTLYTSVGGVEGAIWTDVVQGIILTVGSVVCVVILLAGLPQGAAQLFEIAGQHDKFSLGSFAFDPLSAGFWTIFIYGLFINLQNFGIDQSYVQRYQTAQSLPAARRSLWLGGLIYIPVSALFLLIGTALFAFYRAQPELLPEALRGIDAADRVFPHFMATALPVGLTGLLIAALFSAAQSTVTTSINSSATVLLSDFYVRLLRPAASDREQLRVLRAASLALGVIGTSAALLMISIKSTLDVWWNLAGIFSGGMLGLFLLGALSRRAGSVQAGFGMGLGLLVLVWAALSAKMGWPFTNPLHAFFTTVLGTLTIFGVGVVLSRHRARLTRREGPPLTIHDNRD
ncbi:MAG: sodium:solute symporter [Candidatus Muproteobacteria bacterium RBG_16_62_13]|uniref:Sodium:solute symporter n=1 Tax=Candidatus Muproteobacteria bacterium RBG_16_62_13 TaxID=1817756 RepID=A0A1F6T2C6_9PROT|nr:MAG: sodium:solute symporter [Candidatus Muproteobacteria bacterium RBG_16_62_13]